MANSALTQGPGIDINFRGTTAQPSTDALRAFAKVIDDFQARVDAGETFAAIGGSEDLVVLQTGDNPHVIHKFQLVVGTDPDASPPVYDVDYIGSAATVADLPATPSAPAS